MKSVAAAVWGVMECVAAVEGPYEKRRSVSDVGNDSLLK